MQRSTTPQGPGSESETAHVRTPENLSKRSRFRTRSQARTFWLSFLVALPAVVWVVQSGPETPAYGPPVAFAQGNLPAVYRYDLVNATSADPAGTFLVDTARGFVWEMLVNEQGAMAGFGRVKMTPAPAVRTVQTGRFRFVPSGAKQTGTFLLDTATGQTWAWGVEGNRSVFIKISVQGVSK